jgi:hypothetical protein
MTAMGPSSWKLKTYDVMDERVDRARHNAKFILSLLANYDYIKDWGTTAKSDAVFSSKEGRLGFLAPERYDTSTIVLISKTHGSRCSVVLSASRSLIALEERQNLPGHATSVSASCATQA